MKNYLAPSIHDAQAKKAGVRSTLRSWGHSPLVIHSSLFATAALWNGGFLFGILDLRSSGVPSVNRGSRDSNTGLGLGGCVESS